jgi:hypothetical protein
MTPDTALFLYALALCFALPLVALAIAWAVETLCPFTHHRRINR